MKIFGLIGYPLGHSFSRNFFNEKFHSENIDAEYVNFEIPSIDELPHIIQANPSLAGLNVTIPYKEKVISYLDELDKDAREIGAVNVIKVEHTKGGTKLKGYNSDHYRICAFHRSAAGTLSQEGIDPGYRRSVQSHSSRIEATGTGGAVRFTQQAQ